MSFQESHTSAFGCLESIYKRDIKNDIGLFSWMLDHLQKVRFQCGEQIEENKMKHFPYILEG